MVRSRMIRTLFKLVICLLGIVVLAGVAGAQTTAASGGSVAKSTAPGEALKAVLLKRGDAMMAAWKRHDRAGVAATFARSFVYVGGDALATDKEATLTGLMGCDLSSYRIAESSVKEISPSVAILLTRQEQQVTCGGQVLPVVMNMTDTYVKQGGNWVILMHTESPVAAH